MPSRHSHVASVPLAPLSEIIKLEPEKEPWCAGYAPSQGRRCHARTNAHGRYSAMMLLNEGTKDLRAGRSIDALLEDLAPYVLCTRFHQNQVSDLTRRWKRQVRTYLDSQVAPAPPASLVRLSSRRVHLERTIADLEDQLALLEETIRDRRLEVARYDQSITINRPSHREDSTTRSAVSSNSGVSASSISTRGENLVDGTARRRSTEVTNTSEITVPRPTQAQVSRQIRAVSVSNPPATLQTPVRVSSTSGERDSQHETSQVNRREVEGECGICFCTLHLPRQDGDTEEAEHSDNDEDDDESDDDESDDDESDDNESDDYESDDESDDQTEAGDDDEEQELTWCKACCGVNFHKQCIDQWLVTAYAPTCPTCRSDWKR